MLAAQGILVPARQEIPCTSPILSSPAPAEIGRAMKLPKPDDIPLSEIAAALEISDPRLAGRLTGPAHLRRRWLEFVVMVLAMAALLGGLPLTLASPPLGCALCVSGFVTLTGVTFTMTRRYPNSRWLSMLGCRPSSAARRSGADN